MNENEVNHNVIATMVLGAAKKWMADPNWEKISKMRFEDIVDSSKVSASMFFARQKRVPQLKRISESPAFTIYLVYLCAHMLHVVSTADLGISDIRNLEN